MAMYDIRNMTLQERYIIAEKFEDIKMMRLILWFANDWGIKIKL